MIALVPTAGSWTTSGDDISGGFSSRFDIRNVTQQASGTGGTTQGTGANCTLDESGQTMWLACPTTGIVYEIDLRDGSTSRFADFSGTNDQPTSVFWNRVNSRLYVFMIMDNGASDPLGEVRRYQADGTLEATAGIGDGSSAQNWATSQVAYDIDTAKIIVGGKRSTSDLRLWALDPSFSNGSVVNIDDATNVRYWALTSTTHPVGSVVTLGDSGWVLWWNGDGNWRAGDVSGGVSSFTSHSISVGGGDGGPRRYAVYLGAVGDNHYIYGTNRQAKTFYLTECTYNAVSSKWELVHTTYTAKRSASYTRWGFGSNGWTTSDTNPQVCWAWHGTDDGSIVGMGVPHLDATHH